MSGLKVEWRMEEVESRIQKRQVKSRLNDVLKYKGKWKRNRREEKTEDVNDEYIVIRVKDGRCGEQNGEQKRWSVNDEKEWRVGRMMSSNTKESGRLKIKSRVEWGDGRHGK